MAPEVIFERLDCLARRCQWKKKALDTPVLSAAGRGVVQVAAHERCVLVQCTVHKNLQHFKNSQSLACFDSRLVMAPEVIFERLHCLARRCQWNKKALGTLVLSAAGRGVVQVAAHGRRCVLVCAVHHPQKPALPEFNHSLCLGSWPCRA